MINLFTKIEVPSFARYVNIKGVAKYRKRGGLGVIRGHLCLSAMSLFDRTYTTFNWFLIETIRLSCTVYEI